MNAHPWIPRCSGRLTAVLLWSLMSVVCGSSSVEAAKAGAQPDRYTVLEVEDPEPFKVTAYIQGVGPTVASDLLGSTVQGEDKFCIPPGGIVLFGKDAETFPVKGGAEGLEGTVSELVGGAAAAYSSTDIAIIEGVIEYRSDVEGLKEGSKGFLVPANVMPETSNFTRQDACGCSTNMDFGSLIDGVFDLGKNKLSITEYIQQYGILPYTSTVDTDAVTGGVGEEQLDEILDLIDDIQGASTDDVQNDIQPESDTTPTPETGTPPPDDDTLSLPGDDDASMEDEPPSGTAVSD